MLSLLHAVMTIRMVLVASFISAMMLFQSCFLHRTDDRMFSITAGELQTVKLAYYSDYFSFIGKDDGGRVAFALDNNRGQDGESFQAEHFVVLHDEKTGWQPVAGGGFYENDARQLETIPDSPFFTFRGTAKEGLEIVSDRNGFALKIAPMNIHIARNKGIAQYRLGSAEATLTWRNRKLEGRVIYEYLFLPAFNRLTRKYLGTFDDFHGIYASIENVGDFYFHTQKSAVFSPLIEKQEGFLFLNDKGYLLSSLNVSVGNSLFAFGFYQWPASWAGSFEAGSDRYEIAAEITERETIRNWVIGGFSMGIVQGRLVSPHGTRAFYGLAELIL